MQRIKIQGGNQLSGTVKVPGDKVSSVHIVLATLILNPQTNVEITNLQLNWDTKRILDYAVDQELIEVRHENGSVYIHRTNKVLGEDISGLYFSRASVTLTAFTLLKYGRVIFSQPGGCGFTERPIDKHVQLLEACGGVVETDLENNRFIATQQEDKPTAIEADCQTKWAPSVGVAVNAYLAALSGTDVTIHNVAIDAACRATVDLLEKIGASVNIDAEKRKATAKLTKDQSTDIKLTLPYDDTVAMTYVMAAVSTRSKITLQNFTPNKQLLALLEDMDVVTTQEDSAVVVDATNPKMPSRRIVCAAYPELASDIGPMVTGGLATLREGEVSLVDTVYDNRSSHVHDLKNMGYNVVADKNTIHIKGRADSFSDEEIHALAPDIRAGATVIIAALDLNNKDGSVIMGYHQVHRGYEDLYESLLSLGCNISEVKD